MAKFIWRKINVWFWKETTRGTAVAISKWTPKISCDFDEKFENIIDESSIGVILDSNEAHVSKRWAEWKIEGNIWVEAIWLPLLSLFGTVSTAETVGTGAYNHAFSILSSNQHPSLTIWLQDPIADYKFPLAMISKATISAKVWEFVTYSLEFMAKKGETATNTVTYTADYALLAKHWTFKLATNLAWLWAASAKCIQSFEITISKNLEDIYCLGTVEPSDFVNKQFTIEWSFEAIYEDEATYKNIALAWTEQAIRFAMIDTSKTIWVSDNPSLTIDLAKASFSEWSRDMGNDTVVNQSVKFKGLYSIADASAITASLINTTASY